MSKSPQAHLPTTEEHIISSRPRAAAPPRLLAAFRQPAVVELPPLGQPVGREWLANQIPEDDSKVSRQHFVITRKGSALSVSDCGSTNGTFLNGQRLGSEPARLDEGAMLRVGSTIFVYRAAFAPTSPAPSTYGLVGPFGLHALRERLERLREVGAKNVLIEGETGTGKELVAQAVHLLCRPRKAYGVSNVAAVPRESFEAHLFGWEKGAFTGATTRGPGLFRAHNGGTVFLDEIGELAYEVQSRLLRLLENREVQPLGAPRPEIVDVAVVAATNQDLEERVEQKAFREDLLARFETRIELPPLRERPEDIPALLEALAQRRSAPLDLSQVEVEAVELLMLQNWSRNARELDSLLGTLDRPGALTRDDVARYFGSRLRVEKPVLSRELVLKLCGEGLSQRKVGERFGVSRETISRIVNPKKG